MPAIEPLGDRVVIQPEPEETVSSGGIIIPEAHAPRPTRGVVMAVGIGAYDEETESYAPLTLNVGDVVVFPKYNGTPIEWGGQEVIIMHEHEVLARIHLD